jgi:hypothetical protein
LGELRHGGGFRVWGLGFRLRLARIRRQDTGRERVEG